MDSYGSSFGRIAVIILAGMVLVGDVIFGLQMAKDVFS